MELNEYILEALNIKETLLIIFTCMFHLGIEDYSRMEIYKRIDKSC